MKKVYAAAMCGLASFAGAAELAVSYDAAKGRCELTASNDLTCDVAAKPTAYATPGVAFGKSAPTAGKIVFSVSGVTALAVKVSAGAGTIALTWQDGPSGPEASAAAGPIQPAPAAPADTLPVPANPVLAAPGSQQKNSAAPQASAAQDDRNERTDGKWVFDYSIPDSPGFFVLGATPENIVQPRTLRELSVAVKNGVDQSGKLKTGVAVDFIPAQLMSGALDIKQALQQGPGQTGYPASTLGRILYNTSISLATIKGSESDDKSVKFGLGVHFPIFDDSDGRNSPALIECLQRILKDVVPNADGMKELKFEIAPSLQKRALACREKLRWNATALTISAGTARTTDNGKLQESLPATSGLWFSYSYGFKDTGVKALEDHAQFLVFGKAMNKETVADPRDEKKQISANSRAITMGLKIGSPYFNGAFNRSWSRLRYAGIEGKETVRRWSVGLEYSVTKDIWLVASTGRESGRQFGENQSFVNTGLRFGSATQTPDGGKK